MASRFEISQADLSTQGTRADDLIITHDDRNILRRLATTVAELAARPIEQEKRKLWYKHNALEATRPLIFCDPEVGWQEIITPDQMECEGELARDWEFRLRKEVFWGSEMKDDRVIVDDFDVPHVYQESDWGMHEIQIGGQDGGSYTWESPLKDYDTDLEKLRFPKIYVDYEKSAHALELAQEVFDGLLKPRLKTAWWWTLGMTWTLVNLRGMTQMMYDMMDHPEGLHKLITFLRDGHLHKLDFLEKNNLLSLNNDNTYVGSGGFGWSQDLPHPDYDGRVRTMDMWGFGESQETVGISPAMFAEFIFPYQLPLLERFGLNCYGCCEPLDTRWHIVKNIPRLRRVSASPWSNVHDMAEMLSDQYIFSRKPRPSDLAMSTFDEDQIRDNLREEMRITRDCRMEFIMKDNHTIRNDPSRVVRWVEIAKQEAEAL
jgi:hypothetical protein